MSFLNLLVPSAILTTARKLVEKPKVLTVATWNMLADGLSKGEFMTMGGDAEVTHWSKRGPRVAAVIKELLMEQNVHIVAIVESDRFHWLLEELRVSSKGLIGGLHMIKVDEMKLKGTTVFRLRPLENHRTYLTECGRFAQEVAAIYGASPNDAFNIDDGHSFFYRTDLVSPVQNQDGCTKIGEKCFVQEFAWKNVSPSMSFHVVSAHMKSGEGDKENSRRALEAAELAGVLKPLPRAVLCVDSNFSSNYITSTLNEAASVMQDQGWVNVVAEEGNECFKMRHAQGGQPKKFGELFYDGIDKIYCRPCTAKEHVLRLKTFRTALTNDADRLLVRGVRLDKEKRLALKNFVTEEKWGDDIRERTETEVGDRSPLPLRILQQLYPNITSPSDHPVVAADVSFADH